jgi:YfiR/HmsC-like
LKFGDPLSGLNVVFIGTATHEQLAAELEASKSHAALTVTETDDALALGSMINFVIVSDKVRFDVAPSTAEARRLKISSQLLSVARKVVGATP